MGQAGQCLPATLCLDLPHRIIGASVSLELLLRLFTISGRIVGAAALRAKASSPRPFPALKLATIWGGGVVYLEFPRNQNLDKDKVGGMKMDFLHFVN